MEKLQENALAAPAHGADERLAEGYALYTELVRARQSGHLTHEEIARRMQVSPASIAYLENRLASGRLPSLMMLVRFARALGKKLEIRFV